MAMVLLLLLIVTLTWGNKCDSAYPVGDLSTSNYYSKVTYLDSTQKLEWNCINDSIIEQSGHVYHFTVSSEEIVVASACYPQTSFAQRIIIGSQCADGVLSTCIGADDVSYDQCSGHRSRVQFIAKPNKDYFVMITGVTKSEFGNYLLTITKQKNNFYCTEPLEISLPNQLDGNISVISNYDSYKTFRGFWYKFKAEETTIFINAANRYTTTNTKMALFDETSMNFDSLCKNDNYIFISDYSPSVISSMRRDSLVVGRYYYLFVYSDKDLQSSPLDGIFQLYISHKQAGDTCENSFALLTTPTSFSIQMNGLELTHTSCNNNNYGFYMSFEGDGHSYAVQTCATQTKDEEHSTSIELFLNSCSECTAQATKNCGFDAYIINKFEKGQKYFLRASSKNDTSILRFAFIRLDSVENYDCVISQPIEIYEEGDSFSQAVVASNNLPSKTGCGSNKILHQGSWYKIKAHSDSLNISFGIMSRTQSLHNGYYMELRKGCEETNECSVFGNYGELQMNKGEEFNLFATVFMSSSQSKYYPYYGSFILWLIVKNNENGDRYDSPLRITELPFSTITKFGIKESNPCVYFGEYRGSWFTATFEKGKKYCVNTCGIESSTTPGTLSFVDSKNGTCLNLGSLEKCNDGIGVTTTFVPSETFEANIGSTESYAFVTSIASYSRINVYEVKDNEALSTCQDKIKLTNPGRYTFATMHASSSRRTCGKVSDGLKGVWYEFEAPGDISFFATTDDMTPFETHIGIYSSCDVFYEDSIPSTCLMYGDHTSSPIATRGTYIYYNMTKGQKVTIFVGSVQSGSTGIGKVRFDWTLTPKDDNSSSSSYTEEDKSDDKNDDGAGLSVGEIVGVVLGCVFALVVVTAAIVVVIVFVIKKKKGGPNYGGF